MLKKFIFFITLALSALSLPSFAAEPVYTSLTAEVVVVNLIAALFAVGAIMISVRLAMKGIKLVSRLVSGG
jgi:hypothetical protein